MAPQKKTFSRIIDELNGTLLIKTTTGKEHVYRLAEVPEVLHKKLALHGLCQKLSDATAAAAGSMTTTEKVAAINATFDMLKRGEWAQKREGQGTLLIRALSQLSPSKSIADIRAFVGSKDAMELKALALNPRVKAVLDKMSREAVKDIDSNALLAELVG